MPLQKLQLKPGINKESTTLANEGTWFETDKVRFRSGYPEKIGGWTLDPGTSNASLAPPAGSFWGVCRSLFNWITLSSYNLLGLGTNLKFYIQSDTGGTFHDATPIRSTTAAGDVTFAATNGSTTLTVTDNGHGAQAGDFVTYSGAADLYASPPATGNISAAVLNREYQVVAVTSNNVYTITSPVAANASDTGNGGASTVGVYQITTGSDVYTQNVGWGAGGWGGINPPPPVSSTLNGAINSSVTTITLVSTAPFPASGSVLIDAEIITYAAKGGGNTLTGCVRGSSGTLAASHLTGALVQDGAGFTGWGSPAPSGVGIGTQLRLWSQANYGEDLLFNPRGGALYYWAVNANPNIYDRGGLLSSTSPAPYTTDADCPTVCNYLAVSDASRFVIGFGVNDYGSTVLNPMLVRWSDQENYAVWTPAITNQAGSFTLSDGSTIITVKQARQEILVWTDSALYSMQYLGPPYVWGFQVLSSNLSIASPNTTATVNNSAYWMGVDKFYVYSGRVETLYCPLRQYIFNDINLSQSFQFFASTNEGFNEIWWFYCSSGSTTVDRYVIYNHLEKIWYYGNLARTAWLDSPLRSSPMAAGYNGQLIYHESGVDDGTTNPPTPIASFCQSADFDIGEGNNYAFAYRIVPDITFNGSTVNNPSVTLTLRPRQNPGSNYAASATPAVTSTQNYQGTRNYEVQQFTEIVYVRVRGRQIAFKISSNGLGVQWQLGVPSLDIRPDGRR
jgi:hypothetical protein